MAGESAFEKRHVDPSTMSKVEGLLEHFNLPPAVIAFVRRNKKTIQIASVAAFVIVIGLVIYDTYREKRIEAASSALTTALKKAGDEKAKALKAVTEQYSGTDSARWAEVELAHFDMEKTRFKEAAEQYAGVRADLDKDDPLYFLTLYGYAQAREAGNEYQEAENAYRELKDIEGYQTIGYTGMARIQETQGKIDKAIDILTTYLATLADKPKTDPNKRFIEEKIARLKVKQ